MTTALQLTQVFNDNFVAYFRSHVAHVNIVGRNFASDHKLLQKVYEDLQEQIDKLAELLRTIGEFMPNDIYGVLDTSEITTDAIEGKADVLISRVYDDLVTLKECYEELMTVADEEGHKEIANYAQDRILALAKHIWMLSATLED
jgi:starvation-inducible DNA-binding protein